MTRGGVQTTHDPRRQIQLFARIVFRQPVIGELSIVIVILLTRFANRPQNMRVGAQLITKCPDELWDAAFFPQNLVCAGEE